MAEVVSLGSVNIDLVARLDSTTAKELAARYDWFPSPDETVAVTSIPGELDAYVDRTHVGGKGSNQAVAAAHAKAETAFCGRVGPEHDEYGILEALAERKVDVSHVEEATVETGKAYVFVDEEGENRIAILEGANGVVDPAYVDRHRDVILDCGCLLLQNEIPMATMESLDNQLADASDRPTILFDPAPAVGAAALLKYDWVDIITPNAYEYELLREDIEAFTGTVVRKRGGESVIVEPAKGADFRVAPPEVSTIDTTGAGDVFSGYLAARLTAGDPLMKAVSIATTAASLATTEEGAQRAVPSLGVVEDVASRTATHQ